MEVDKSDNLITFDFGENFTFGSNNSFDQNIANSYSYVTSIRIVMLSVLLAAAVVGNSLAFHKLVTNRSQNSLPGGWFSDSQYLMHKYICFLLSLSKFAKTNKTIIHHLLFLRPFRRGKERGWKQFPTWTSNTNWIQSYFCFLFWSRKNSKFNIIKEH